MVTQYENNLLASVYLWAQWRVLQYGQAYFTGTQQFYYLPDPSLPTGYVTYSSPFKSIVYDSGVSGALIMQSVNTVGYSAPLDRSSGLHIDYTNGRVILPSSFGTNLVISGSASWCETNFYTPVETDEQLLTQNNRFYLNPLYNGQATGGIAPYVYCTPAVFVNTLHNETNAFQFGGLIDCGTTYSFSIFAQSVFQLQALLSIFRDTKYQYIPMLTTVNDPLDGFGDTKGGSGFNYVTNAINAYGTPGNLIYIKDIRTARVSDRAKMNQLYFIGVVEMDLSFIRQAPIGNNLFT